MEALGAIIVFLVWASIVTLIGLKPRTWRGVIMWALIIAAAIVAAMAAWDLAMLGQSNTLLGLIVAFVLNAVIWAVPALAIRAIVDRVGRRAAN